MYQNRVHYMGIKIFTNLPPYIKDTSNNVKKFEICLKQFLNTHSFYSIEEYFQHKSINLPQPKNVPLNVFNKTIYLIYSLNNLYLLSLSLTKKINHYHINVIHMHIIAFCIHFSTIACFPYLTCSSVCNYSHIFLCIFRYTVVCVLDLESVCLIQNFYIIIYFYIMYYS
jgi:hypothetical protein